MKTPLQMEMYYVREYTPLPDMDTHFKGQSPLTVGYAIFGNKGRSPYNGKLSDFSFYIDSQISVHRKIKK
jgi:hypothetical protein